jgi:DNA repair exonuclease SbcCD ATPase subunit
LITFKCIRYKNILSTGNAFTEIDFIRNKTTLVIGENGAGKSTMLDALSFVLYGKPFRKINKPQLINSVNEKGLIVEVEFDVGKSSYLIRRGIKPGIFEIHQNGNLISQQASVRDYQDYLEKNILKMNHKSFSQVVVLGSSTFVPFMQLSASQRREVIEDLLDLQIFSTMNNLLKERLSQNKGDIREIEYQIDLIDEKIEMEKKHLNTMVTNHRKTIDDKQKQIADFEGKIGEETKRLSNLQTEIRSLEDRISDKDQTEDKKGKVASGLQQLQRRVNKISKEIEFFNDHENCPTCQQDISIHFKEQMVEDRTGKLTEANETLEMLEKKRGELETRMDQILEVNQQISDLNSQVSDHNRNIFTYNEFVSSLNKEITDLSNKVDAVKNTDSSIDSLKQQMKGYRERKTDLGEEQTMFRVGSEMLRDSGIKSQIIKQYVPVMNKLVNHYLQQLGFFVQFELDENFNEKIRSRYRDEFSYESFSEGEKIRIDLALLFTWRTVAKLRNSVSTNLLIMDEVFDSSLDGNGTEEFLKILEGLTADTNTFIISHKGDVIIDKFRSIIRFEKHGNFSRIAA